MSSPKKIQRRINENNGQFATDNLYCSAVMAEDYGKKIVVFTVISLLLTLFAFLTGQGDPLEVIFFFLTGAGSIFFMVVACYFMCKLKGLDTKWSLAGLFHIAGLIILAMIKNEER